MRSRENPEIYLQYYFLLENEGVSYKTVRWMKYKENCNFFLLNKHKFIIKCTVSLFTNICGVFNNYNHTLWIFWFILVCCLSLHNVRFILYDVWLKNIYLCSLEACHENIILNESYIVGFLWSLWSSVLGYIPKSL